MYIAIAILIKSTKSTNVSLSSALQSLNAAQLLKATCVATPTGCFTFFSIAGSASGSAAIFLVTVIFSVTKIYASE